MRRGMAVHIGVGLRVARSIGMGNARASVYGTGGSKVSTLFVYVPQQKKPFIPNLSGRKHRRKNGHRALNRRDNVMQTKICLSVYGEMYMIDLAKVMYLQADDHYTHVYYSSGTHFMVPFGLSKVEAAISGQLTEGKFLIRLGRKYIVNTRRIFHVNSMKQVLQLSDDHGTNHSLRLPKPVLHSLMQMLSAGSAPLSDGL